MPLKKTSETEEQRWTTKLAMKQMIEHPTIDNVWAHARKGATLHLEILNAAGPGHPTGSGVRGAMAEREPGVGGWGQGLGGWCEALSSRLVSGLPQRVNQGWPPELL